MPNRNSSMIMNRGTALTIIDISLFLCSSCRQFLIRLSFRKNATSDNALVKCPMHTALCTVCKVPGTTVNSIDSFSFIRLMLLIAHQSPYHFRKELKKVAHTFLFASTSATATTTSHNTHTPLNTMRVFQLPLISLALVLVFCLANIQSSFSIASTPKQDEIEISPNGLLAEITSCPG
jgi:hypothetical protein